MGIRSAQIFFFSSSRMFVIEGKEGRDEMKIVQKAQDKNVNFSCGQVFSKYGVNKIYMWAERKKLVEKRKERHIIKKKQTNNPLGGRIFSVQLFGI